jgi:FkbM family methyltransferase
MTDRQRQTQGFLVGDHPIARTIRRAGRPVRSWLRRYGLDVVPSQVWGMADIRQELLAGLDIDLVVDAGANAGQYALTVRERGYGGAIFSIEPTEHAFQKLSEVASEDPLWTCARCALGETVGERTINVSANSYSSSLLPMLPAHADVLPKSRYVAEETVEVARLDKLISVRFADNSRIFLKADVQGFEDRVLAGASGVLQRILLVELEVTFRELYEGQMLFPELHSLVVAGGFDVVWIEPGFRDPATQRLLQADALYVRRGATNKAAA